MSSDFTDMLFHKDMDFGHAIRALKAGKRVQRMGWNGKGMFLFLFLLRPDGEALERSCGGLPVRPCIAMRTADGAIQPGWLASQADILGEDWQVVP